MTAPTTVYAAMAKGLDMIAISDHKAAGNASATQEAARTAASAEVGSLFSPPMTCGRPGVRAIFYAEDEGQELGKLRENPEIKALYDEYLRAARREIAQVAAH